MKKLSKVLSLVLVIAMVFSLCVIGASASYADFTDTDKITDTYKEAVDVMTGVGIIDGMNATTFDAQGNFTRAQAAKIIAYMQLGPTAAAALKGTGTGYKDVAATAWYAPYVAYCTQMGIIGGYGNGNFGPNDVLTGYQFAKMLLCAVGYGANKEYTGSSWSINVAKDGLQKGVFTDVLSASTNSVITREQATQMAFNTLTGISKVTYSALVGDYVNYNSGISGVTSNGTLGNTVFDLGRTSKTSPFMVSYGVTTTSGTTSTYRMPTTVNTSGTPANYVTVNVNSTDIGRYGYVWYQYIGSGKYQAVSNVYFTDTVLATASNGKGLEATNTAGNNNTWTVKPTAADSNPNFVCALDSSVVYYYNGAADTSGTACKAADEKAGAVFTFIDKDGDGDADTVSAIVYSVATLTAAPATKAGADGKTYIRVPGISAIGTYTTKASDVSGYEGLAKNDVVLYYQNTTNGMFYLQKAESVTGKVSAVTATYYTLDNGKTYSESGLVNAGTGIDTAKATLGKEVTFYLDTVGNVVATNATVTASTNYCIVIGKDPATTLSGQYVKLLFADGTTKVVKGVYGLATDKTTWKAFGDGTSNTVNEPCTGAKVYNYTVVNDVYYLYDSAFDTGVTAVDTSLTIAKNTAQLASGIYANANTVFVMYNTTTQSASVFTGISNVPNTAGTAYGSVVKSNVAGVVFVYGASYNAVTATDTFYIFNNVATTTLAADGTTVLYTYNVVKNGKIDTITFAGEPKAVTAASPSTAVALQPFYAYTVSGYDANGYATGVYDNAATTAAYKPTVLGTGEQAKAIAGGTMVYGSSSSIVLDSNTKYFSVSTDGKYTLADAAVEDILATTTSGETYSKVIVVPAVNAAGVATGSAACVFIVGSAVAA